MGQDDLTVWHYVPVGLGLFGGQLLTLGGALGPAHLLHLGAVFTLVGWGTGLLYLLRMLWRDGGKTWHAVSCAGALFLGFVGLLAYAGFLHVEDARLMFAAIKIGTRSEEHTSELQSLMRISYAVFCLKKKNQPKDTSTLMAHIQTTTPTQIRP